MYEFTLDDAPPDVGAPPVLRDAPPQAHHHSQNQQSAAPNSPGGATATPKRSGSAKGGSSGFAADSPQLSKDSLNQLRQLDASSPSKRSTAAAKAAAASSVKKDHSNLTGRRSATPTNFLDTQRELQEEEQDIQDLVEAQRKAAQEGRFLDAHRYQKMVKEAAVSHQHHVENDMHYSKMQALLSSREITHAHRDKLMIFTTEWEKQLGELERRAAEERNELASRHQRELAEQEEIIRSQIAARTANQKSRALTEAQQTVQRLSSQQFYFEAHQAQRHVEALEAKERNEREKKQQRELARRMSALRSAKAKEMSALEARIDSAREALLTQRARDYEVLVLKQYNKQVSEEQKVRVEFGKRRTEMGRKMVGAQTRIARRQQMAQTKSEQGATFGSKPTTANSQNSSSRGRGNNNHNNQQHHSSTTSPLKTVSNPAAAAGRHLLAPMGIEYKSGRDELPLPVGVHPAQSSVSIVKSSVPAAVAVYGGAASSSSSVGRANKNASPPIPHPPPKPKDP